MANGNVHEFQLRSVNLLKTGKRDFVIKCHLVLLLLLSKSEVSCGCDIPIYCKYLIESKGLFYKGKMSVTNEFDFISLSIVGMSCIYTIYMLYYLIKYFNEKSPHLQTLLDGFYVQLGISDINLAIVLMILEILIELNVAFKFENEIITLITSWLFYNAFLFNSVSLATSCIARAALIFCTSRLETVKDQNIWLLNG